MTNDVVPSSKASEPCVERVIPLRLVEPICLIVRVRYGRLVVSGKLIVPPLAVGFTKRISAFLSTFDMASLYLRKWITVWEEISRKDAMRAD